MGRLDFFKKHYSEADVLERSLKRAKGDTALFRTVEVLYFDPTTDNKEIADTISQPTHSISEQEVKLRYRPQAMRILDQERAKITPEDEVTPPTQTPPSPKTGAVPPSGTATSETATLEDMEAEAVRVVMKANTGISLDNHLKKLVIFLFKTFSPFAVLLLTIPESIYVFTHLYTHPDDTLRTLTGIFAILVDCGYLYLTVLVAMNEEALFRQKRAGLEVESHERHAVRLQKLLWWAVALMDTLAQAVFLYGATKDSTFFSSIVVLLLAAVRVLSLFITMFVVSFAGTELMTSISRVTTEQVGRASSVARVLESIGQARLKRLQARGRLQRELDAQELQRQGDLLLSEIYAEARESVRKTRGLGSSQRRP